MAFHNDFSVVYDEIQGHSKIVRKKKHVVEVILFPIHYFAFQKKKIWSPGNSVPLATSYLRALQSFLWGSGSNKAKIANKPPWTSINRNRECMGRSTYKSTSWRFLGCELALSRLETTCPGRPWKLQVVNAALVPELCVCQVECFDHESNSVGIGQASRQAGRCYKIKSKPLSTAFKALHELSSSRLSTPHLLLRPHRAVVCLSVTLSFTAPWDDFPCFTWKIPSPLPSSFLPWIRSLEAEPLGNRCI